MDPFQKKDLEVEASDIQKSIKKNVARPSKPVKFTWKGAADFIISASNTPLGRYNISALLDKSKPRITDLAEGRDKPEEKDYIDFFEDMEKSVFGAAQSLGYSFGDLATTGIDIVAGTGLTEKLDEVYEKNKIESPETFIGSVNKILIEFGVPGGAVVKILNRSKKLFKGKKAAQAAAATGAGANAANIAKRAGYMAAAFGVTDFIVANPDRENLVLEKENEEGLSGRDLALARFRNRIRFGAEGTVVGGGFGLLGRPLAKIATVGAKYGLMKPAGYALTGVDTLVVRPVTYLAANIPGSATAGKKIRQASRFAIDKALSTAITLNPTKQLPEFS